MPTRVHSFPPGGSFAGCALNQPRPSESIALSRKALKLRLCMLGRNEMCQSCAVGLNALEHPPSRVAAQVTCNSVETLVAGVAPARRHQCAKISPCSERSKHKSGHKRASELAVCSSELPDARLGNVWERCVS